MPLTAIAGTVRSQRETRVCRVCWRNGSGCRPVAVTRRCRVVVRAGPFVAPAIPVGSGPVSAAVWLFEAPTADGFRKPDDDEPAHHGIRPHTDTGMYKKDGRHFVIHDDDTP